MLPLNLEGNLKNPEGNRTRLDVITVIWAPAVLWNGRNKNKSLRRLSSLRFRNEKFGLEAVSKISMFLVLTMEDSDLGTP